MEKFIDFMFDHTYRFLWYVISIFLFLIVFADAVNSLHCRRCDYRLDDNDNYCPECGLVIRNRDNIKIGW